MRLAAVTELLDGAVVARDIRAAPQDRVPIIAAGVALGPAHRRALERAGIRWLFVDDDVSAGIAPLGVIPVEARIEAVRAVADLLGHAARAAQRRTTVDRAQIEALEPVAKRLALEVCRRENVVPTLGETGPPEAYLPAHCVDVALVGMLVAARHNRKAGWIDPGTSARRYDVNETGLYRLGLALMLMDLGTAAVPRGILQQPGPLDAQDRETVTRHVAHGVDLLPAGMSYIVQAAVRGHHERWDGSGYPEGRAGEDIPWEARVAAIADVFDATTSNRVYCLAVLQHEGWSTIVSGAGKAFDPELVGCFRDVVVPYPPATEVVLPDGRAGVVARVDETDPLRPVVRARREDGGIEELAGVPVQPAFSTGAFRRRAA